MVAGPILRMQRVSKSFPGVRALADVDFAAHPGEAVALLGANGAGKSTLMNVLGGVTRADAGQIEIDGRPVEIRTPGDAARAGITFVHQEMVLLPTLSVVENMFITTFPTRRGVIDRRRTLQECSAVLARLGSAIDPNTRVQDLATGDRQIVEIARALLGRTHILILDEPTSSLTSREKARLFDVVRRLKSEGVAVIYITHFLNEAFELCERVCVMRGGAVVEYGETSRFTRADVVRLMVGEYELRAHARAAPGASAEVVLEARGLRRAGVLEDVGFDLHRGEILGLWGLLGSGRTEIVRALTGLDPLDGGAIRFRGPDGLAGIAPAELKRRVGMITEDRRGEGLLLPMSVRVNMSIANLRSLTRAWLFVDGRKEIEEARRQVDRLGIRISSLEQPVATLSGGNQQKVIVGRWLQCGPPIMIMDEPTRGLDVRAKAEITRIIDELAAAGTAILLINSEIDEMVAQCDRYLVVDRGRIVAELPAGATRDQLLAASHGLALAGGTR